MERIGAGGMGTVFLAEQLGLGREVALKVIGNGRGAADDAAAARCAREAKLLAALAHPAIVTVFDFGADEDGTLFLAMERVEGEPLAARLLRGPLPERAIVHIGVASAAALHAAHDAGILHRDLKPHNVMLTTSKTQPVKLIDFGLARLVDRPDRPSREQTVTASYVMGTPGYSAPEYALTGVVTAAADHYALGLLLAEAALGVHPYAGGMSSAAAVATNVARVAPGLAPIVQALLAPDPRARLTTPLAALSALQAPSSTSIRSGSAAGPALATPPGALEREQRPRVPVPSGIVDLVAGGRLVAVRVRAIVVERSVVTNREYAAFARRSGRAPPAWWGGPQPPVDQRSCPVVGVSPADAAAFAHAVGGRLPTEAEWTWAACGAEGWAYPWGERYEEGLCHQQTEPYPARRPGPVGLFSPLGDNPRGLADLLSVWEWTSTREADGYVVRGGPWRDRTEPATLMNRSYENVPAVDVGFRVVYDVAGAASGSR